MALHVLDNGTCLQCDDDDLLDEDSAALLHALNELDGPLGGQRAAFDPSKHLRNPKGSPGGGRFRSNVDKLKDAITAHRKGEYDGHPFDGFSREQLRRVAKARGIELGRGESKESISTKLLEHLDEKPAVTSHVRKTTSTGKLQPHVSGEAERDLNAKVRAAKKNLTPGQLKAVEQWTSGKGMVRKIQTGQVSAETANNFDEAMKTLPKVDGLVYRAVSSHGQSSQFAADLKPGQVLDLGAPVSTSIDPRQSGSFGTNLYEIESPSASYLAGIGSKFGYEKEAVLPPGQYEVVSSEYATIGLGKNTAKVLVVRLKDVTQGDRSWKPTSGTDFKLHESEAKKPANVLEHGADPILPNTSATGQAALDAAPVQLGKYGFDRGQVPDTVDADALRFYAGHGYIEINAFLREGRTTSTERKGEWAIAEIDSVMDRSALTRDIQVHRGLGDLAMFGPAGRSKKSLVGMEFTDLGYASATVDPNVADEFYGAEDYGGHGAILHITVPRGTKAIQLSGLGPKPKHHWELPRPAEDEAEVLLQRGLTYRIVGDQVVDGVRQLDVEVVPA